LGYKLKMSLCCPIDYKIKTKHRNNGFYKTSVLS